MKIKLLYLITFLACQLPFFVNAQVAFDPKEKSIVLCESYSTTGSPSGIASYWDIDKTKGGYVYILYTNGTQTISTQTNTLLLFVDKLDKNGDYQVYDTKTFDVKTRVKYAVFDYKFTEEGTYKISAYQKDKTLATTIATINYKKSQTTTTNTQNYSYNNTTSSSPSIVACEDFDDKGTPKGVYSVWNITDEAHIIPLVFKNGNKPISTSGTLYLYVDKKGNDGKYFPYGTEKFNFKTGDNWAYFDFAFNDPGEYKIAAMQLTKELASTNITVKTKSNSTINTSKKSIVTASNYDLTSGKPSGIYTTWNIQKEGGYVYVVFDNTTKINGNLWLYVDKKNSSGDYVAFDTKTFEHQNKSWATYKFTFTEPGDYKISAVSSKGEEASTFVTVNFADGVEIEAEKSVKLVDSYDDYGKPIGENSIWNISPETKSGWVYILFNNGEKMKGDYQLYLDKKSSQGKYITFDTQDMDNNNKDWTVFDYNFTEIGDYKISVAHEGDVLATTYATIKYKQSSTTPTTSTNQNQVTSSYYSASEVFFAEKADLLGGSVVGKNTEFTTSSTGKELKVVFKQNTDIKTTKIYVDIYTGNNYDEFVETKTLTTTSSQKAVVFPYTFKKEGAYKFAFYNQDEIFMNIGEVKIKPSLTNNVLTTSNTNSQNSIYNSLTFTNTPSKENRTALVIGNGNYVSAGKLPNPVHDAEEMAKVLKACGFNVTLIVNANKKQMNEAVQQFGMDLKSKKGTGLVFYAGHGVQAKGENYLIPIDANLYGEEDLQYECVNVNQILAKMDVAKNEMNIIMLDACRNNPFERSWNRSQNGNGLASINAPDGTIIAYSTNPGNVASDGTGYNSPYTTALLKLLNKPGLTIEQVLKGVAYEVKTAMPGQLPWYSSSITGEFYFRP